MKPSPPVTRTRSPIELDHDVLELDLGALHERRTAVLVAVAAKRGRLDRRPERVLPVTGNAEVVGVVEELRVVEAERPLLDAPPFSSSTSRVTPAYGDDAPGVPLDRDDLQVGGFAMRRARARRRGRSRTETSPPPAPGCMRFATARFPRRRPLPRSPPRGRSTARPRPPVPRCRPVRPSLSSATCSWPSRDSRHRRTPTRRAQPVRPPESRHASSVPPKLGCPKKN